MSGLAFTGAEPGAATPRILDLFAGPGGWDLGLREHGLDALGLELEPVVCDTRRAAGLLTVQADVAAEDPHAYAALGLIGSPPCQAYSQAGKRAGITDQQAVYTCARQLAEGQDTRAQVAERCGDPRSLLVVEPLRWALALRPEWVALEQVPEVLGLWRLIAGLLERYGYRTWVGMLNAADYGVPQVRRRAFMLAHRERSVAPPEPTHAKEPGEGLFGSQAPWVSMAEALGWDMVAKPYPTIASSRTSGGPDIEKVGGSGARAGLYAERDSGRWLVQNARSKATTRHESEPAPTITGGHDHNERVWVHERPSTTVQGDPRVWAPGHKQNSADPPGKYQQRRGDQAIRVELHEAAVLQGFPADYPWQGTRSQQFLQVGNAVPPPLAKAVLGALL